MQAAGQGFEENNKIIIHPLYIYMQFRMKKIER
jgi:hypothetical protein